MKHKILLFASGYKTSASANGICARNLVREFVKQGHEVYVVAVPHDGEKEMEEIDGAKVWFVEHDKITQLLQALQKRNKSFVGKVTLSLYSSFRALLLATFYPNTSLGRVNKLVALSCELIEKYGIDTVIGTCLPYSGITAAIRLKRMYKDKLRVVTYHFDILSTPNNKRGIVYSYKQNQFAKAFNNELIIVDRVFLPETAIGLHDNDKISYIGLPVYISDDDVCKESSFEYPKGTQNITYIGSIGGNNRPIFSAIELVRKFNNNNQERFMIHVWGNVTDGITKDVIRKNPDIVAYHGLLDNSEARSVLMRADFLLNISNAILYRLLPSKMFSMFATGKPIINIVFNPDDCSLPFFEKYGNSKQIRMWESEPTISLEGLKPHIPLSNAFDKYKPSIVADRLLSYDKKNN